EFVPNPSDALKAPVSGKTSDTAPHNREKLRHILIGTPKVVRSAIHLLHVLGYAEATAWSPLQPTANPGEVISILVRYVLRD
ncbi:MAG TPA: hypothetical protein DCE56_27730, partial [Cyanobacteria bacterium UBA8553]|nr:hypothetical protein [Cyanobacteria bacterium UBA8553]